MIKRTVTIILLSLRTMLLSACGSNQEKHKKSLEEQLVDSFAGSEQSVRERVDLIVEASESQNYAKAMNELAMLSAVQINSAEQKYAIKRLMDQLRFNLEEVELAHKNTAN